MPALIDNFDLTSLASGDDVWYYELLGQMERVTMQGQDRRKREGARPRLLSALRGRE